MSTRRPLPALEAAPASAGIVDVLTGAKPLVGPVPPGRLSVEDAADLTARIRHAARDVADRVARLLQLVDQAIGGEAWHVLGYPSVAAYVVDVVEPMRLGLEQRRMVVGWLSGKGLSTRAIAPILQVDQKTVVNDRRAISPTGEEGSSPDRVTGLDGRSYAASPAERPALVVVATPDRGADFALPDRRHHEALLRALAAILEVHGAVTADDWHAAVAELVSSAAVHRRRA